MKKENKMGFVSIGTLAIASFKSYANLHMRKFHNVISMLNVEDRTADFSTQNTIKVVKCHVFFTQQKPPTPISRDILWKKAKEHKVTEDKKGIWEI